MSENGWVAGPTGAAWWREQRGKVRDFGLPGALAEPLLVMVLLVLSLGVGSAAIGLLPGVDTHAVTLSGAGAPWIGLVVLGIVAALWYGRELRRAFSLPWMAGIAAAAVVLALLANSLALDSLAVDQPDALIGSLGMGWLLGGLLLLMGFLFEGFTVSLLMGVLMGILLGVLLGFVISFDAVLIMVGIYGPLGGLAGGLAGTLRPLLRGLRRRLS